MKAHNYSIIHTINEFIFQPKTTDPTVDPTEYVNAKYTMSYGPLPCFACLEQYGAVETMYLNPEEQQRHMMEECLYTTPEDKAALLLSFPSGGRYVIYRYLPSERLLMQVL